MKGKHKAGGRISTHTRANDDPHDPIAFVMRPELDSLAHSIAKLESGRKDDVVERRKDRRLLVGSLVVSALVLLVTAWLGYETTIGVSLTRTQFVDSERPYLWLTDDVGVPRCVRAAMADPSTCQVLWDWHFTNYGKTPALRIHLTKWVKLADGPLVLSLGSEAFQTPGWSGEPIPPNKVDFTTVVGQPIQNNRYGELVSLENQIEIRGKIHYTDANGGDYESGFCLRSLHGTVAQFCSNKPGEVEVNYVR
jgi:hypothetical protein